MRYGALQQMLFTPSNKKIIALIDCNSFYCSCEKLFRPDLKNKPVIVLSNNDGVTIARSAEAKAVGIKMGDPHHLIANKIKEFNVHVFSSNFALYGDISERVHNVIASLVDNVELYSIDEAFVDLTPYGDRAIDRAKLIKDTVYKHVGIPVSVGIASNKVLAKIATDVAKNDPSANEVFSLIDEFTRGSILETFPVSDIWGIGRKSVEKLNQLQIFTAKDLKEADPILIHNLLTIVGRKILEELKGYYRFELEEDIHVKKKEQLISSRSFGKPIFTLQDLAEAVSFYACRAAEKLRKQHSYCNHIQVFAHTNPFKNTTQYYKSASIKPKFPTNSSIEISQLAIQTLSKIFKPGIEYKKAGVMLADFSEGPLQTRSFFEISSDHSLLMKVIDDINQKHGRNSIEIGASGSKRAWQLRSNMRSPCYTTKWHDLLEVC